MNIPNSTQVPNIVFDELLNKLDEFPFKVLMVIIRKTYGWIQDPETGMRKEQDWIAYSQFQQFTGGQSQAISRALKILEDMGLIEVRDIKGNLLSKANRLGKKLYYRFATPLSNKEVTHNPFVKQSLSNKDTKETYTKTLLRNGSVVPTPAIPNRILLAGNGRKRSEGCPLTSSSPLIKDYPNGHTECLEYLTSFEKERPYKFTNRAKQFNFIHKMIKAGVGFDKMDSAITKVEKSYGRNQWDFATIANWMDKGGGYA